MDEHVRGQVLFLHVHNIPSDQCRVVKNQTMLPGWNLSSILNSFVIFCRVLNLLCFSFLNCEMERISASLIGHSNLKHYVKNVIFVIILITIYVKATVHSLFEIAFKIGLFFFYMWPQTRELILWMTSAILGILRKNCVARGLSALVLLSPLNTQYQLSYMFWSIPKYSSEHWIHVGPTFYLPLPTMNDQRWKHQPMHILYILRMRVCVHVCPIWSLSHSSCLYIISSSSLQRINTRILSFVFCPQYSVLRYTYTLDEDKV